MNSILSFDAFINEKNKNPCWRGYRQLGTKKKKDRVVPNCVKVSEQEKVFDRTDYYLNYYKNLSPEGFNMERKDNFIVIEVNTF
jgi:hypothetical protein